MRKKKNTIGLLGVGEIGSAMGRIAKGAGFKVLIRELKYDQIKKNKIDYLHISIPEKSPKEFIDIAIKNINELKPKLTIVNSSTTPGTTIEIFKKTKRPIVHSPVIGLHPNLDRSIKKHFPKIIGPVNKESAKLAVNHLKNLGLKVEVYSSSTDSEAAKLLDLVYFAWNIIFCKWMHRTCKELGLNFDDVYTKHNNIYNEGYKKLQPNIIRPVMIPQLGPIGGHCTIPDTELIDKFYANPLTRFILEENQKFFDEVEDIDAARKEYIKLRERKLVKKIELQVIQLLS